MGRCNSTYRLRYWNEGLFELAMLRNDRLQQYLLFTVLKQATPKDFCSLADSVATVLTVYGIETSVTSCTFKPVMELQQYLPFTVLKLTFYSWNNLVNLTSCNSTYRLRYWNFRLISILNSNGYSLQ